MSKRKFTYADCTVQSHAHDGRGVARINDKTIFLQPALAGEQVEFQYTHCSKKFDEGRVTKVVTPSPHRVDAPCPHFEMCGGCSLQHVEVAHQLTLKQQALLEQLQHFGQTAPQNIMPPLTGPTQGYRHKARLGVRYVHKKEKVLVGFRERNGRYLAELQKCLVLHPSVGEQLDALASLIHSLEMYKQIAQIEVAVADEGAALIFRHLQPLPESDINKLIEFAGAHNFHIYLQPKGPNSITKLHPKSGDDLLSYTLNDHDLTLYFHPSDFIQINPVINQKMIMQALHHLNLQPTDKVLDLFCGLGNFTLPIAKHCQHVVGVEGSARAVERAKYNAAANNIDNADFYEADLAQDTLSASWLNGSYDKILLDPPRSGAAALLPQIEKLNAKMIVYVSCNPATLARDAGTLIQQGYRLTHAGIMDMFPHTGHVESMAIFTKEC